MTAHRDHDDPRHLRVSDFWSFYTDAEFASAFRPAEHLDQLLEAVRLFVQTDEACGETHGCDTALLDEWDKARLALCSALRQWEEG